MKKPTTSDRFNSFSDMGEALGKASAARADAARKGWDVATAERWLAPILNYDPYQAARDRAA